MLGVVLCISCMVCLPGEFFEPCGTDDICISCRLDPPAGNLNLQTQKIDIAFRCFLLEPDDRNEYLLCESVPASLRPYLRELGQHLRTQQEYGKEQKLKITDYENYIEKWAHEIKKPLSLMTLLLDNRKGEMSPLVHTRMLYVRDYARQSVEQILYFSRLGAVHKDYCFEQLSVLETCREAVEDNFSLLEEAGFSVVYTGDDRNAVSDKKGFMFILGQIISNSVKYAGKNPAPTIQFSVADHADSGEIILSISDNGTGTTRVRSPVCL